ncbi:hypothetical protein CEXT_302891 [Caerostris extrusa]|uniref:Uncharacterized protein n=1 Tax=Caerostris extrusa TaxID=172846 RepID=A0AAV4V4R7_CAEEX|nr:hypothetical protein CEXT_302891 [Caerostris extrusa]
MGRAHGQLHPGVDAENDTDLDAIVPPQTVLCHRIVLFAPKTSPARRQKGHRLNQDSRMAVAPLFTRRYSRR